MLFHLDFFNNVGFGPWFFFTPLFLTKKGVDNVYIFFVISGFVLPLGFFKKPSMQRVSSAIYRRYFRLMIPMFAMYIFTYFIHCLYRNFDTLGRTSWVWQEERRRFYRMLYCSVIGVWKGEDECIM